MRLLLPLFAIGSAFMCDNCLPPKPPRTAYIVNEVQEAAVKILSLPSCGLTQLEVRLAAQDLAKQAQTEKGLLRMLATGAVVDFLLKWRTDIQVRLSLDYGPLVFDEAVAGLFTPATHWILYTHPEDIPSLPVPCEGSIVEEARNEGEICPVPRRFPYTFPRKYRE